MKSCLIRQDHVIVLKKTSLNRFFFNFPLEAIFFNPTKVAYQNFICVAMNWRHTLINKTKSDGVKYEQHSSIT